MIREWMETVLGDVVEASNGSELRANCPFCEARIGKPDVKQHLYVSTDKPLAMCFRCTWQGNYVSLIIGATGCSYTEALRQLEAPTPNVGRFMALLNPSGLLGALIEDATFPKPDRFRHFEPEMRFKEERAVWNYLTNKRRIPMALVRKYTGWAPGTNRAWILVDKTFWQGRLIIPGDPKYKSAPWPKGDAIWNAGALNDRNLLICEGVFSAIAAGSSAIALCGKTMTEPQAKRIAKTRASSITIMLDADATQFSYDIARQLEEAGYAGVMKIHELETGDPTDGVAGRLLPYDWSTRVRQGILTTV